MTSPTKSARSGKSHHRKSPLLKKMQQEENEVKTYSRTSPKIRSKELNGELLHLTRRSIGKCLPKRQTVPILEN